MRTIRQIMRTLLPSTLILVVAVSLLAVEEPFQRIKAELSAASCCEIRFLSVVHSEVFESVDTTNGAAYIAQDGRYGITVGPDSYVQTADYFYSYSDIQNQVTVELSDARAMAVEEVTFLNRLDDYYSTESVRAGVEYALSLRDTSASSLPADMRLWLSTDSRTIDRLEYRDINDDLNQIVIIDLKALAVCDTAKLRPRFPDSAEVINLF